MPVAIITKQLSTIPKTSGVYQFFDCKNQILYIGKAKNLYKRLQSYTKLNQLSPRIGRMVFLAEKIEYIQTKNEAEALLLEHNLIKKLSPKFNILLRDDKTFPYIEITNHKFPRLVKNRDFGKFKNDEISKENVVHSGIGKHRTSDNFQKIFGPFASAHDVNRSIDVLRKIFQIRNCSDAEFKSRKKPCLEYQIKKCSGPCVNLISENEYHNSVANAVKFLSGRSAELQRNLSKKMQEFSDKQNYEKAAFIRDQIKSLNAIQVKQNINIEELKNSDVISFVANDDLICIYISFYRLGQNYGSKSYFYKSDKKEQDPQEFLSEFLGQFYLSQNHTDKTIAKKKTAKLILLNIAIDQQSLMENFLSEISGEKTTIKVPSKGKKLSIIKQQEITAKQVLEQKSSLNFNDKELLLEVQKIFNLTKEIKKIEIYDNSHTGTKNAVGVLVTAGEEGFIKSGYRKFNLGIKDKNLIKGKDDTAMIEEVFRRRFSKLEESQYPDLIIIDGGKPQLNSANEVFKKLKVKIPFIAMAKGENRNAGEETFFRIDEKDNAVKCAKDLSKNHPVMYYLQRLRDEAHRFAITTHRKKRAKAMLE